MSSPRVYRRSMRLVCGGHTFYRSSFDPSTGVLVREVTPWQEVRSYLVDGVGFVRGSGPVAPEVTQALVERFPHRYGVLPSPSPELIDIGITNRCTMGCKYCYTDSTPQGEHAPKELVTRLITTLDAPPYQVAFGGGEPTLHPDLPWMLEEARKLGTVPNYTTSGSNLTDEVIGATNEFCGGVALSYHAHKGMDWFAERYQELGRRLRCQLNVHLIADIDVARNLHALLDLWLDMPERSMDVVLLAYHHDVGRASFDRWMDRRVYEQDLPAAIHRAIGSGMRLSFSEGLLPYFMSRPELGLNTSFAMACEGIYSCYVDQAGRMHVSSFSADCGDGRSILDGTSAQQLWEQLRHYWEDGGGSCQRCEHNVRCQAGRGLLMHLCRYQRHNRLPL